MRELQNKTFLKTFLPFVIIAFVLSSCGTNHGKEKNFDGVQLFYTDAVTEAEADALGAYFISNEYANGEKKTVQLNKTDKTYQCRMVMRKEFEKNQKNISLFKAVAASLSVNVFKGAPVEIHICDDQLETIQVVTP